MKETPRQGLTCSTLKPEGEKDVSLCERSFEQEKFTDGWNRLQIFIEFDFVENSGFARRIEAEHQNSRWFIVVERGENIVETSEESAHASFFCLRLRLLLIEPFGPARLFKGISIFATSDGTRRQRR